MCSPRLFPGVTVLSSRSLRAAAEFDKNGKLSIRFVFVGDGVKLYVIIDTLHIEVDFSEYLLFVYLQAL